MTKQRNDSIAGPLRTKYEATCMNRHVQSSRKSRSLVSTNQQQTYDLRFESPRVQCTLKGMLGVGICDRCFTDTDLQYPQTSSYGNLLYTSGYRSRVSGRSVTRVHKLYVPKGTYTVLLLMNSSRPAARFIGLLGQVEV